MKGSDRFRIDGVRCLLYGEPLGVSNLSVGRSSSSASPSPTTLPSAWWRG
jgi:hypothetical protein